MAAASRLSQANVNACVARGLAVVQGDADTDLVDYPGAGVRRGDPVPDHPGHGKAQGWCWTICCASAGARRSRCPISAIGRCALSLLAGGRMPRTRTLDYSWWDTPNIHLCTLADFVDLTRECGATIVEAHALNDDGGTAAHAARTR